MTLEECEEFYEENALGYFYGYAKDDERFSLEITFTGALVFRNESDGVCEDPKLDWFPM
jgi:hypothetical protein